jgi:hypothetical protein
MHNGLDDLNEEVRALRSTLACGLGTLSEIRSLHESVEAFEVRKYIYIYIWQVLPPWRLTTSLDMRRELEKILYSLDEPIVRMADQLSDLHDNFKSKYVWIRPFS